MRSIVAILLICVLAPFVAAQDGSVVNLSEGPAVVPWSISSAFTTTDLTYKCFTRPYNLPSHSWTVAETTLTSIAVSTNTATLTFASASGIQPGNAIEVSGATVDTDLNGVYVLLTASGTTGTFTTSDVADATYNESTLEVASDAPRTIDEIWYIQRNTYDGSSNKTSTRWAIGKISSGAVVRGDRFACTDAANLVYE